MLARGVGSCAHKVLDLKIYFAYTSTGVGKRWGGGGRGSLDSFEMV